MLNISKALNSSQAQTYHKVEFTSDAANYYNRDGKVQGEWQGQLVGKMGLSGAVTAEEFARLTDGRHPLTNEQMVKHREGKAYKNEDGSTTKPVEHRAGWDATFSAPKSVSLTALVGGDERVREAHREAVTAALTELERFTQARIGGNNPAETTGKFIAAKFEHDTARPVGGYAAPQLHTHVVIFNVTEREDGSTRALQPQSFFDAQNLATAVYQSTLMYKLNKMGYEIEAGRSGAPEIKGYSQEYLDASSPRSQQIREHLERTGHTGAEAAQIAAHATRDKKQILTPAQVLAAHKEIASSFGDQAGTVVTRASDRALHQPPELSPVVGEEPPEVKRARDAINYAREHNTEREAVIDEKVILRDALRFGMGKTTIDLIEDQLKAAIATGRLIELVPEKADPARKFTTPETLASEKANLEHVVRGQNAVDPLTDQEQAVAQAAKKTFLNPAQQRVIQEVLTSTDRIHGLQGLAGTGKTTVLSSIREGAEESGYTVEGFAPTARAAAQLREADIEAATLQSFLRRGSKVGTGNDPASRHLYMLDESSLASTTQVRTFLDKLQPNDRVLLIGDVRQHQGVEAGRPFEQMQEVGMRTSQLDQIMRQKDPELLKAVELLATGKTAGGVRLLIEQGRVAQIENPYERYATIAKDYTSDPGNTIIVSPDNRSRVDINGAVRAEKRENGTLAQEDQTFSTLSLRSDMTGADRAWAARYKAGNVIQYLTGSRKNDIEREAMARVITVNERDNTITVKLDDGRDVTYDPKRLRGVNVYREVDRDFAVGDRIQFNGNNKGLEINNRDLGTVQGIEHGKMTVLMDGKKERVITFDPSVMRTFDHGYAVTSHSSQGLTQLRVIVNVDTDGGPRSLLNTRLAYVAISRASHYAKIYTDRSSKLVEKLTNEESKTAALDHELISEQKQQANVEPTHKQYATTESRLAAVAQAYAERPESTVAIARDPAERRELNRLIRAQLQEAGKVSPDSVAVATFEAKSLSNRKLAEQYVPGDLIQYRQGSATLGIENNSVATVVAAKPKHNDLTVQTEGGDQITYRPHTTKTLTGQSEVYRVEQRELAEGDRVQFTLADTAASVRNGDLGTVTAVSTTDGVSVRLDKGSEVQLTAEKPAHLDYGYAIEGIKTRIPERVLLTQETAVDALDMEALSRNGREVNTYIADQTPVQKQETEAQSQPVPNELSQSPVAIPQQPQMDAPATAAIQQPDATAVRMRMGR